MLESEESAMDVDDCSTQESDREEEGCACEDMPSDRKPIPAKLVTALLNGEISLPERELFPLPPIVNCLGGCSEDVFCRLVSSATLHTWLVPNFVGCYCGYMLS
jgi:hypothetical protein